MAFVILPLTTTICTWTGPYAVLAAAPVNVPLTPPDGFGVVTGAGVFVGVLVGVLVGVFVGVFVGFLVGVAVALPVEVGVGEASGVAVVPPASEPPVPSANPVVDPNCGGVIERTAPRPPTVPPAIKKKRLVSIVISLIQPSEIQILHYGNDPWVCPHREQLYVPSRPNQSVRRCTRQSR